VPAACVSPDSLLLDCKAGLKAEAQDHPADQRGSTSFILANLCHCRKNEKDARQLPGIEKGSHRNSGIGDRYQYQENVDGQNRQHGRRNAHLLIAEKDSQSDEIKK
jgi:hypothetical protein